MTRTAGEITPGPATAGVPGWAGAVLLTASAAGAPITWLALRRPGRGGSLLAAAACAALCARDTAMTLTGTPALLRPLPRELLFAEVATSAGATAAALTACWRRQPGTIRAATAAATATFVLHTTRLAIYLSPGQGRREPPAPGREEHRSSRGFTLRPASRRAREDAHAPAT